MAAEVAVAEPPPPPPSSGVEGGSSDEGRRRCDWPRVKAFLLAQHLPLGLLIMVLFGFLVPQPGIAVGKTPINTISICGIFLISGLQLQTAEVRKALKAVVAIAYGLVAILALTPCLAFGLAVLPIQPPEFPAGLALFAVMPTTISSGVLMTTEAKGNTALALLFSVVTNVLGVLTVPFFLQRILTMASATSGSDNAASTGIDPWDLLLKLSLTILLPLLVGKAARYFDRVAAFVTRWKLQLKLLSSALLISVPWITMSQSASTLRQAPATSILSLMGLGAAMHLVYLVFNYLVTGLLPMGVPERKAVVINASQKTVNTAMSVIQFLPPDLVDRGLLTLPCIIAHFVQIIIDAFLVARWKKWKDPAAVQGGAGGEVGGAGGGGQAAALAPAGGIDGVSMVPVRHADAPWDVAGAGADTGCMGLSPRVEEAVSAPLTAHPTANVDTNVWTWQPRAPAISAATGGVVGAGAPPPPTSTTATPVAVPSDPQSAAWDAGPLPEVEDGSAVWK